jgi:Iodothyronine deiodinase
MLRHGRGNAPKDSPLTLQDVLASSLLSELPVALVFGSYTWPPLRAQVGTLEQLAQRYSEGVHFLAVYIREAHPEDGWIIPENRRSGLAVHDPQTDDERRVVASTCAVNLRMRMPMVIDRVDNAVASVYGGWPDRLYLIRSDGRIAYQGGEGPFGFKPEALERAIAEELGERRLTPVPDRV